MTQSDHSQGYSMVFRLSRESNRAKADQNVDTEADLSLCWAILSEVTRFHLALQFY